MGWLDVAGGIGAPRRSVSETEQFGFSVDRLSVGMQAVDGDYDQEQFKTDLQEALTASDADIRILRFPSECLGVVNSLDLPDFIAVNAGSIMYWEKTPNSSQTTDPVEVRSVEQSDGPVISEQILRLVNASFEGYLNHYSFDPFLPAGATTSAYVDWASRELALNPHRVFFLELDGVVSAAGIVDVVKADVDVWEVLLAGVSPDTFRKGLYSKLLLGISEAASKNHAKLVISTQVHNIAVQRAWAKLGLRPLVSIETVHLIRRSIKR